MSKFKLLIILGLIIGAVAFGINQMEQNLGKVDGVETEVTEAVTSQGITWYQDGARTFNVAIFDAPLVINYRPENAQTIKEQAILGDLILAVNGGFFRGSYVDAEYAGLLQLEGEVLFDIAEDDQLSHIAVYDAETTELNFQTFRDFPLKNYADEKYSLFQTGPLVIEDNKIQTETINKSLNGTGRHLRTLLGYTDSGEKFVVVTRVNFELTKLAETLLSFEPFIGKKINVINLDGGTSTAMYSSEFSQFNFGDSKRLPNVLGVRDPDIIVEEVEPIETEQVEPAL